MASEKICVQKILPEEQNQFHNHYVSGKNPDEQGKLQAAFLSAKIWPKNSKIKIGFLSDGKDVTRTPNNALTAKTTSKLDPIQNQITNMSTIDAVKLTVNERIKPMIESYIDISFVDDNSKANVLMDFNPDKGAWALVGTDHIKSTNKNKQSATINLGWFDIPTLLHELGHMLGMIHEHQNPDGNPIDWKPQAVYSWAANTEGWSKDVTKKNILQKYDSNTLNSSEFDPLSVMLYFFPGSLTEDNIGTHENLRLSGMDVLWICKMYNSPSEYKQLATHLYEKFYNEDITDSLNKSAADREEIKDGGDHDYIPYLVVFVIICVGVILLKIYKKL